MIRTTELFFIAAWFGACVASIFDQAASHLYSWFNHQEQAERSLSHRRAV
jgi:hypothetical protein